MELVGHDVFTREGLDLIIFLPKCPTKVPLFSCERYTSTSNVMFYEWRLGPRGFGDPGTDRLCVAWQGIIAPTWPSLLPQFPTSHPIAPPPLPPPHSITPPPSTEHLTLAPTTWTAQQPFRGQTFLIIAFNFSSATPVLNPGKHNGLVLKSITFVCESTLVRW